MISAIPGLLNSAPVQKLPIVPSCLCCCWCHMQALLLPAFPWVPSRGIMRSSSADSGPALLAGFCRAIDWRHKVMSQGCVATNQFRHQPLTICQKVQGKPHMPLSITQTIPCRHHSSLHGPCPISPASKLIPVQRFFAKDQHVANHAHALALTPKAEQLPELKPAKIR